VIIFLISNRLKLIIMKNISKANKINLEIAK